MSKNIQKVQDMLDGNYKSKIQVGVGDQEVEQKIPLMLHIILGIKNVQVVKNLF